MDNTKHRRLQELDRSDFELVKGDPDIRGWDVKNGVGQKIGEVEELIVDAREKKVRYMVVDLDDNELKLEHRKVLLPIGLAELHKEHDDVLLPAVTAAQVSALPAYAKDGLDEEMERIICRTLGRDTVPPASETTAPAPGNTQSDDFYKHDYFHDDNLYKHRLHEAQPAKAKEESEYEKGLRLWEMRSEGGTIGDTARQHESEGGATEEERMERVRNRRRSYEERRGYSHDDDRRNMGHQQKDSSIIGRIKDEGLQDA